MYAVIKTGGKQHKVQTGDHIKVELLEGEAGDTVVFEPILVVDDGGGAVIGKNLVGAEVTATLMGEQKQKKIHVFKYRSKTGYKKKIGHRQRLTQLEITGITVKGGDAKPKTQPKSEPKADKPEKAKPKADKPEKTEPKAEKAAPEAEADAT